MDVLAKIDRPNAIANRWWRAWRWTERSIAGVLLFVGIFSFPELPALSLDPSWRLVLTRAFYDGLQFGRDVVFTYGPLGFLMGNTYDGIHFWVLIGWQVVKSAAFAAVVLQAGERLPVVARWAGYAAVILFGAYFDDMLHLSIVLLLGLWCVREDNAPGSWATVAIGGGLALLSVIKFTSLLLASGTVVVCAITLLRLARRGSACALLLGYVGGFISIWLLTRQSLGHVPDYLLNAWRISRGYEESMSVPAPSAALWKALIVLGLVTLTLGLHLSLHRRQPRAVAGVLLIAAYGFVTWKHGFIRADGHMGGFFTAMLLPATMGPALLAGEKRWRLLSWVGMALAGVFSLWGLDDAFTVTRSNAWAVYVGKLSNYADHVVHWNIFRASYDEEARRLRVEFPLTRTREMVGRSSIDVLGHDAGLVCLHDFNYQPRPVFQGYLAYTPALEQLNVDAFLSARAPEYVLQKVQTIDGRLLTLDDAWLLRLLPQRYEFLFVEDGYTLWRRRPAGGLIAVHPLTRLAAGQQPLLGEALNVERFADKALWLEIDLGLSLLGRLRAFGYQTPIVRLRLTDTAGVSTDYRLPLAQARGGFILNPIIDDAADYLAFLSGQPRRRVKSLALLIESGQQRYFANDFHFSLNELLLPPVTSLGGEVRAARFHMFKSPPAEERAFIPFTEAEIDGHPVIIAHAPSEMKFDLPVHAARVVGGFGFTAGAYSEGGHTDGATFQVAWIKDAKREVLFSRHLDPVNAGGDRGLQSFAVDLGARREGRLLLEVTPGPAGNNSWDWTGWTAVEIQTVPAK